MPKHVRKGDQVIVNAGRDKGRTGQVLRVLPGADRVVVQGVNVRTRKQRPNQANPQGGLVHKEMPIHLSNVQPVVDGKPTRVRFQTKKNGAKVRIASRGGSQLGPELKKAGKKK
ncbi:MAG: 50S ribosomal protein L24 [Phycisphaeraceae bacterium]|nr:50S ribosomal protein L24 [Phycisphaeraceae bacterium]